MKRSYHANLNNDSEAPTTAVQRKMSSVAFVLIIGLTSVYTGKSGAAGSSEHAGSTKKESCIAKLGCFDVGEPWSRQQRVPRPSQPNEDTVLVYFYTRLNAEDPHVFTTYPDVDINEKTFTGSRPTVVIIHDHRENSTMEWIHTIKYFYLLEFKSNVLLVDYSEACQWNYVQSVSNARVVGKLVARLLKYLKNQKNLRPERIHLIGHGLGAHVASYVAKDIPRISRLTALDPARPLFEGRDSRIRLDRSDASFVEVIHTNGIPFGGYGMVEPHGHVDFYFNDGGNQPGCFLPPGFPTVTKFSDVINLPIQYITLKNSCNQDRSYEYLIEAYNPYSDCTFWGHRVTKPPIADTFLHIFGRHILSLLPFYSDDDPKLPPCTQNDCIPFGYNTYRSPLRGIFVVKTYPEPPYCIRESVRLT